jgi:membrane protease YdiL (CAAX protease family)
MDEPSPPVLPPEHSPLQAPSIQSQPAPRPLSTAEKVFLGHNGLRSGWSFLLYLLMGIALAAGFSQLLRLPFMPHFSKLWGFFVAENLSLVAAMVPALVMAKVEKRPFGIYGLPPRGIFGKLFWVGMLWGIVAITVLMLAMRASKAFYFGQLALDGRHILKFAIFWAVFFVVVGLFEEFLLRGYTQFTLTRGIGFWPSAILLSAAFGGAHLGNKGEDIVGALAAALIGLFFCLTLRRTGNLWFAVGLHTSWDWGETFLYSVPNSGTTAPGHLLNSSFQGPRWLTGGSVGPEASIFVFIVIALMWLLFHLRYREAAKLESKRCADTGTSVGAGL